MSNSVTNIASYITLCLKPALLLFVNPHVGVSKGLSNEKDN